MNKVKSKNIVTVAVVTYHSAETVLETLDSIVNQSYGSENIELIVSDDGSKDDTVQVIEQWLSKYKAHFFDVKFFANKINGGIPKNCNVAWKAATSEWIKTIAGDDILFPNCIEDNVKFVQENTDEQIAVVFSKMQHFNVNQEGGKMLREISPHRKLVKFYKLSPEKQFKHVQRCGLIGAPSAFVSQRHLQKIGFADERFPLMEDIPIWFKLTQLGYKLTFMDKVSVYYRVGDSVSNSKSKLVNENFIRELIEIDKELIFPTLKSSQIVLKYRKLLWTTLAVKVSRLFGNKRNVISLIAIRLVFILFKPAYLTEKLRRLIK